MQSVFDTQLLSLPTKKIKLVLVCAWCKSKTHKALKEGEQYSHGICKTHKMSFLQRISQLAPGLGFS